MVLDCKNPSVHQNGIAHHDMLVQPSQLEHKPSASAGAHVPTLPMFGHVLRVRRWRRRAAARGPRAGPAVPSGDPDDPDLPRAPVVVSTMFRRPTTHVGLRFRKADGF